MTNHSVRVRVPATSANLGPGFDSLGLALQLHSYISIRRRDSASAQRVVATGLATNVPLDESNICYRAAVKLLQHIGAPQHDFVVEAENNIPLSRGLGSSSAARVGSLVAANEWARQNGWRTANNDEILSLATELEGHPDNAASALFGGLVVSAVYEKVRDHSAPSSTRSGVLAVRMPVPRYPLFLVWIPRDELSTTKARAALRDTYSRVDAVFNVSRASLLLAALSTSRFDLLPEALHDRLHQPYRAPLMPGYAEVVQAAVDAGALGATLSGAGSSVLLWLSPEEASTPNDVRQAVQDAALRSGAPGDLLSLPVDNDGCVVVPE
ncbi:MAG TPA: homoserine kinase [Abditibacteriaceae bacterium]